MSMNPIRDLMISIFALVLLTGCTSNESVQKDGVTESEKETANQHTADKDESVNGLAMGANLINNLDNSQQQHLRPKSKIPSGSPGLGDLD